MTLFEKFNENGKFKYNYTVKNMCVLNCKSLEGHYDVESLESICSKIDVTEKNVKSVGILTT